MSSRDFHIARHAIEANPTPLGRNGKILSDAGTNVVPTETIFRTALTLKNTTPEKIDWLVTGYVAPGAITEFCAKIKLGKTTLILHACRALLDGIPFLGLRTKKVPAIVYLTEQPDSTFREALDSTGLLGRPEFSFPSWYSCRAMTWPEVVLAAVKEAKRIGAPLVAIDTLTQWAGIKEENNSGEAYEAMNPLQEAAGAYGLAILIARHDRKGGGSVEDSGRGSSAFSGAADIILSLRRAEGNAAANIRVIHALGRFRETPATLVVELTPDGYRAIGSEAAVAERQAAEAILEVCPESEDKALTEAELFVTVSIKRTTGRIALNSLVTEGTVTKAGSGKKGDAFRYFLSKKIHCDGTTFIVPTESISGPEPTSWEEL